MSPQVIGATLARRSYPPRGQGGPPSCAVAPPDDGRASERLRVHGRAEPGFELDLAQADVAAGYQVFVIDFHCFSRSAINAARR